MDQALLVLLTLMYFGIVGTVAVQYRHHESVDSYLVARRAAGSLQVSQGLFTLIGSGEFVTMAVLGYTYGINATALFIGYSLSAPGEAGAVQPVKVRPR